MKDMFNEITYIANQRGSSAVEVMAKSTLQSMALEVSRVGQSNRIKNGSVTQSAKKVPICLAKYPAKASDPSKYCTEKIVCSNQIDWAKIVAFTLKQSIWYVKSSNRTWFTSNRALNTLASGHLLNSFGAHPICECICAYEHMPLLID